LIGVATASRRTSADSTEREGENGYEQLSLARPQRRVPARELLDQRSQFAAWWYEKLTGAIGTPQQNAWLKIGAECEAAAGVTASFEQMDLSEGAAELLLNTGLVPPPGSTLEAALLDAVLDGECPRVRSTRYMPAKVAAALSPGDFLTSSKNMDPIGQFENRRRNSSIDNVPEIRVRIVQAAPHSCSSRGVSATSIEQI
jgi:hypothetical protein